MESCGQLTTSRAAWSAKPPLSGVSGALRRRDEAQRRRSRKIRASQRNNVAAQLRQRLAGDSLALLPFGNQNRVPLVAHHASDQEPPGLSELGWRPKISFEDGVRETVEWYRANEEWWRPKKLRVSRDLDEFAWSRSAAPKTPA